MPEPSYEKSSIILEKLNKLQEQSKVVKEYFERKNKQAQTSLEKTETSTQDQNPK